ncbi:hypothetical protein BGX23_007540 [Mortierella sp. AD031]|nr:hypothetical protein BGX23_007540 [Mortierella sp. AD031]
MDTQKEESMSTVSTQLDITGIASNNSVDAFNDDPQDSVNSAEPTQSTNRHTDNHDALNQSNSNRSSENGATSAKEKTQHSLPSEIMIAVFGLLSIQHLIICQRVSRDFRVIARTIMLDKLGGQVMNCQRQHCPQCHRQQQQQQWQRSLGNTGGGGGYHGLPPLPHHYLANNTSTLLASVPPTVQHHHHQQPQDPLQHQLHYHFYQHQSTEDMAQHHQTDLHIHHQSHSYNIQQGPQNQQSFSGSESHHASQYYHTASCVAPGNIALFLFPYHDHTPTSWQDRQSVHFVCTGIDRLKEQLVFSPIYPETGDCLQFNTNTWNLPSTFVSGYFGEGGPGSYSAPPQSALALHGQQNRNNNYSVSSSTIANGSINTESSYKSPSTGLDLFDYSTGRPRFPGGGRSSNGQAKIDSLNSTSYSFANQFNRSPSRTPSSLASSSTFSLSSSSSSSSITSFTPSTPTRSSLTSLTPPSPSWANINGHGGEHYSVIGIKHGNWPEDRQAAGRWWGGGLHSSMTQESMVYMPWIGASSGFDFHGEGALNSSQDPRMENASPTSKTNAAVAKDGCSTKIHRHHMHLSSSRVHNPPAHHHRFLCLHHDQLMADIAAFNTATAADPKSRDSTNPARPNKTPVMTAGSRYLEVDYSAKVTESKRCLFCLSTPCKANLEIQVKFDQLRVSLDWVLSGFDQKPRSHGSTMMAGAISMANATRQGQVPS